MSTKARLADKARATPFVWARSAGECATAHEPVSATRAPRPAAAPGEPAADDHLTRRAEMERDAFVKGDAQGERAGLVAGVKRTDAVLRRLGETIDELAGLRRQILQHSEQQLVQLALALARRIVRRELVADEELLGALARVALERLGEARPATIRLNPEDFARSTVGRLEQWAAAHVSVVSDPSVNRGGCLVESPFGFIDASIEAQLQELAGALLESTHPGFEGSPYD
jgi:flagellar assembly protein FliH